MVLARRWRVNGGNPPVAQGQLLPGMVSTLTWTLHISLGGQGEIATSLASEKSRAEKSRQGLAGSHTEAFNKQTKQTAYDADFHGHINNQKDERRVVGCIIYLDAEQLHTKKKKKNHDNLFCITITCRLNDAESLF